MGKTVKLTFLPEGIDSTIDRIRQLGEKTEEAMKEASRATRGLGMAGADLRDSIDGCKDAIARHEQELAKLAPAYITASKEAQELEARLEALQERRDQIAHLKGEGTYGIELEEINAEIASTCDKLDEYDDTLNKGRSAMRHQSDAIREVVADMRGYEKEAIAARQATLEEAKARKEATQEARKQREAIRAERDAKREAAQAARDKEKADDAGRKAAMGLSQAQSALAQLMRGNLVGAARSATSAFKQMSGAMKANASIAAWTAVGVAIAGVVKMVKEAIKINDEYCTKAVEGLSKVREIEEQRYQRDHPERETFSLDSDEDLDRKIRTAQHQLLTYKDRTNRAALDVQLASEDMLGSPNDSWIKEKTRPGWNWMREMAGRITFGAYESPLKEQERLMQELERAIGNEKNASDLLDRLKKERDRRKTDRSTTTKADADKRQQEAERIADRRREFERDLEQAKLEAAGGKDARLNGLEYRRGELLKDRSALEEKLAPFREAGMALDPEDEKKLLDLEGQLLRVNQQISSEKAKQAEEDKNKAEAKEKELKAEKENLAAWQRGRKLEGMNSAADRVSYINNEIAALRQQPATIENRQRMRQLIDERDAAQKEADAFAAKKQDYLHRNDTDAQRMASIGKQLAEAGVKGDEAAMLELLMSGEEIAENYKEPLTKRQQRRADRKAERNAKAAMRAAKTLRKQMGEIEAAWAGGDKSAAEKVAGMTIDASGKVSSMQMSKDGKLVKVEGQDYTNTLLEQIKKALE